MSIGSTRLAQVVLFVTLAVEVGCGSKPTGSSPEENAGKPVPGNTPHQVAFKMSAKDLFDEIKRDKDAAQKKYEGKWVELSGEINFVGEYKSKKEGRRIAVASPGQPQEHLYCSIPQASREPGRFSNGQKITVEVLVGKWFIGQPTLTEGEIKQLGPDQSVSLTAEEIASEVAADQRATEQKYGGKTVRLTGKYTGMEQFGDQKHPLLEAGPGKVIKCRINWEPEPELARLKVGDRVTLVGQFHSPIGVLGFIELFNDEVLRK